jgi:hypothetical protein
VEMEQSARAVDASPPVLRQQRFENNVSYKSTFVSKSYFQAGQKNWLGLYPALPLRQGGENSERCYLPLCRSAGNCACKQMENRVE